MVNLIISLDETRSAIVDAVAERGCARAGSAFARVGVDAARKHVEASLSALERDIGGGTREQVRAVTYAMLDELAPHSLSFSDVRLFIQTLRKHVRDAMQPESCELRLAVEDWFYEFLMVASLRFMAWRDEMAQKAAAQLDIRRLESQLAELGHALTEKTNLLSEKTELLEIIRQASIPIAPVFDGILVVPLVGMFDSFRAEILTEKLLGEIARVRARTAILDISGVPVFDTHAAELIIRLARTVRLLGTRVFLVGMSPDNARTIVDLQVDLTHIETLATLRDGLARALSLQRMRIAAIPLAPVSA
jgi:anti-anti-sigma regulatory factor